MRLFSLLLLLSATAAPAQTAAWLADQTGHVTLDARYAPGGEVFVTDNQGTELGRGRASYVSFAPSARVPVGERLAVLASLPVTIYDVGLSGDILGEEGGRTFTDLANPYLGLAAEVLRQPGGLAAEVEAGVWLPVVPRENRFTSPAPGFALDRENLEAYKGAAASVQVVARAGAPVSSQVWVWGQIAPVLSYFTGDPFVDVPGGQSFEFPRTNLGVTAAAFGDIRLGAASLTAGLRARYEPPGGTDNYSDKVFVSGLVGVALENLPVRPALHVRSSLAGNEIAAPVLGLAVGVPLQ